MMYLYLYLYLYRMYVYIITHVEQTMYDYPTRSPRDSSSRVSLFAAAGLAITANFPAGCQYHARSFHLSMSENGVPKNASSMGKLMMNQMEPVGYIL